MEDANVRFLTFSSVVDPSFWHKLCQIKLEEDKLDEKEKLIRGFYLQPSFCAFQVDCTSFNKDYVNKLGSTEFTSIDYLCTKLSNYNVPFLSSFGHLINFNSEQKFKECNKNDLMEENGKKIRANIKNGEALNNPNLLTKFILITYANLKTYDFIYWFGFPVLSSLTFKKIAEPKLLNDTFSSVQINTLLKTHSNLSEDQRGMFAVCVENETSLSCKTLKEFIENRKNGQQEMLLCFLDPSSEAFCPGWSLRNLLALVAHLSGSSKSVKVICLRIGSTFKSSFVLNVQIEGNVDVDKWIGWEKNKRDKFGPRTVSLRDNMDPLRLAESGADLNLKLMKWRINPNLDLDTIKNQKCLLLGAGTLGCSVARCLMSWGVRTITFVDNGYVSFSNPVRQSLYFHEDCDMGKGPRLKAPTAAEALKKILPSMNSLGIVLDIPMAGHATSNLDTAQQLHHLIASHDALFLLTDSRESRWFPTLVGSLLNKITITSALGYDTYLVMRHGYETDNEEKLGCYFCNDIYAPGNAMEDRTLDQQCTVTRPGVANIGAALTVELFVSILQHKDKGKASSSEETNLGLVPHSIRGFLSQFNQILPSTKSYSKCTACSSTILKEYSTNKQDFLTKAFQSNKYLEDLTGLTEFHKLTEVALQEVLALSDEEIDVED